MFYAIIFAENLKYIRVVTTRALLVLNYRRFEFFFTITFKFFDTLE